MIRFMLCFLFLCFLPQASYAQALNYDAFSRLVVLHEGRIKPLETFARSHLKLFSAQENLKDKTAIQWLAQVLFDPAQAAEIPVFLIRDKGLKQSLNLPEDLDLYSLVQMQEALEVRDQKSQEHIRALLQKDSKDLTPAQNELLSLHEHVLIYLNLTRSFSLILPLNIEPPKKYKQSGDQTYMAYAAKHPQMLRDLKGVIAKKGEDIKRYSEQEQKLAALSYQLSLIEETSANNNLFKVVPAHNSENFLSPWEMISSGQAQPMQASYLEAWQDIAQAYREGNIKAWDQSIKNLQGLMPEQNHTKITLEIFYNTIHPYSLAMIFYTLALGASLWTKISIKAPQIFLALAALIQVFAIGARIYILGRPPVGTLYESILFVSAVVAVCGFIYALRAHSRGAIFASSTIVLILLAFAPYLIQKGEKMEMLVAVLNTNFWLTTHVLVITGGYALCLLACALAHGLLIGHILKRTNLGGLQKNLMHVSLVALFFTALGTILGGIWADQSWGRFWGWDPKENGALLIVLWLIWLQHGRLSGHLRPMAYTAGHAFLSVVVALSWFGVNLLNVGLHSYGFIEGIAMSLGIFCTAQTAIIAVLWLLAHKQESKRA